MSEKDVNSDQAMFDAITSPEVTRETIDKALPAGLAEPTKEPPAEAEESDEGEQPGAQGTAEASTEGKPQREGRVPSSRLREANERARRAEELNADLQRQMANFLAANAPKQEQAAPKKPVDMFDDPQRFVLDQVDPVVRQMSAQLFNMQRDLAVNAHTEAKVSDAQKLFDQMIDAETLTQAEYDRVTKAPNPFNAVVAWHEQRSRDETISKAGGLDKYIEAEIAKRMADPNFQRETVQTFARNAPRSPNPPAARTTPSLSTVGAAGVENTAEQLTPREMFDAVTSAPRRRTHQR